MNLSGLVPISSMATVLSTHSVVKGKERVVHKSSANTTVWIYNISQKQAIETHLRPLLTLPVTPAKTTVLRVSFLGEGIPEQALAEDPKKVARQELERVLGAKGYVDIWNIRCLDGQLRMQVRMSNDKVAPSWPGVASNTSGWTLRWTRWLAQFLSG